MRQIKILAVNDPAVNAYLHEADNGITKMWEEQNHMKVIIDIVEWSLYKDTLDQVLQGHDGTFDIIMNPGNFWLPELAEGKLIVPLDRYLTDYDLDGIMDSILDEMRYNDRIYMLPSFSDGHILFYRKDILKDKGIIEDKHSISIQELLELVQRLENDKPVIALKSDVSEILLDFIPFLWERGVELTDKPPYFSDEEKTLLALRDYLAFKPYCPNGIEQCGNQEVKKAIQKGEVAIGISWGAQAADILNPKENPYAENIDFMTYENPCNTTWGFAVASNSREKEASVSYLKFITNEANDKQVGRISGGPVRKTTYQDADEQHFCPWYDVQFEMLKKARNIPKSVEFAQISFRLYSLLHHLFTGKITSEQFAETCKKDQGLEEK